MIDSVMIDEASCDQTSSSSSLRCALGGSLVLRRSGIEAFDRDGASVSYRSHSSGTSRAESAVPLGWSGSRFETDETTRRKTDETEDRRDRNDERRKPSR